MPTVPTERSPPHTRIRQPFIFRSCIIQGSNQVIQRTNIASPRGLLALSATLALRHRRSRRFICCSVVRGVIVGMRDRRSAWDLVQHGGRRHRERERLGLPALACSIVLLFFKVPTRWAEAQKAGGIIKSRTKLSCARASRIRLGRCIGDIDTTRLRNSPEL